MYEDYSNQELREELRRISDTIQLREKVSSPSDAIPLVRKFGKRSVESFFVVTLDGSHVPIKVHEITRGLVNRSVIHPRETFRVAIKDNAIAIIIGHNHPSGSTILSSDDLEAIRRMTEAGKVLGIAVLDHLLVTKYQVVSAMETGDM